MQSAATDQRSHRQWQRQQRPQRRRRRSRAAAGGRSPGPMRPAAPPGRPASSMLGAARLARAGAGRLLAACGGAAAPGPSPRAGNGGALLRQLSGAPQPRAWERGGAAALTGGRAVAAAAAARQQRGAPTPRRRPCSSAAQPAAPPPAGSAPAQQPQTPQPGPSAQSAAPLAPQPAAPPPPRPEPRRRPVLTPAAAAAVEAYLGTLNEQQRAAALGAEQHQRVIAGPGSGKTRVVAARVARLIAEGVDPSRLLVFTFTRKAAGELQERLQALLGSRVARQLHACTFHSLCHALLREHGAAVGLGEVLVADDDDVKGVVTDVMLGRGMTQVLGGLPPAGAGAAAVAAAGGAATESAARFEAAAREAASLSVDEAVGHFGRMKNFVESTYHPRSGDAPMARRAGADIVGELSRAGVRLGAGGSGALAHLGRQYDAYVAEMEARGLVDFNDLLHAALAIVQSDRVRAALHERWSHVLVDESQDTNPCQFALIRAITGPQSSLFMVGDADQAIYAFRGADSALLTHSFRQTYAGAVTRHLTSNYRSREAIVRAADLIRFQDKTSAARQLARPAAPMRRNGGAGDAVVLVAADNEFDEADQALAAVQDWRAAGYEWGQMALLFRAGHLMRTPYSRLVEAGVPAHMQIGKDFWESAEVKVALALLRCVVGPAHATGARVAARLVKKGGVALPLTAGLGEATIAKLVAFIADQPTSVAGSGGGGGGAAQQQLPTLGACLFAGCAPDERSGGEGGGEGGDAAAEAAAVVARWRAAQGGAGACEALQGLAPPWAPPAGLASLKKGQLAAVAQLRGLVVLGRAVAALEAPEQVLHVRRAAPRGARAAEPVSRMPPATRARPPPLMPPPPPPPQTVLEASGVQRELEAAAAKPGSARAGKDDARRRLNNLGLLARLARNPRVYDDPAAAAAGDAGAGAGSSSSSSRGSGSGSSDPGGGAAGGDADGAPEADEAPPAPPAGLAALRRFADFCTLMGENDEAQAGDRVELLTMHASKGREWDCVAVLRCDDGNVPSLRKDDASDAPDALQQEQNLLYVAATRARDHLLLTWPRSLWQRQGEARAPSRFLAGLLRAAWHGELPGAAVLPRRWVERAGGGADRRREGWGGRRGAGGGGRSASEELLDVTLDDISLVRSPRRAAGGSSRR
ncbi:uvrD [Scenedesmus sp. PABB004]|nr:uvrD [Scenedesmus sp. PABB004]